ncbi:MAG: hypothetical protein LBM07_03910 [Culturomica sp.]|nr:hypothetical protein [Culturomica sp.]
MAVVLRLIPTEAALGSSATCQPTSRLVIKLCCLRQPDYLLRLKGDICITVVSSEARPTAVPTNMQRPYGITTHKKADEHCSCFINLKRLIKSLIHSDKSPSATRN